MNVLRNVLIGRMRRQRQPLSIFNPRQNGKCASEVDHLARLFDSLANAEIANEPGNCQAKHHSPVQIALLFHRVGHFQHFVFPKFLSWRRPIQIPSHIIFRRKFRWISKTRSRQIFVLDAAAVGRPVAALCPRQFALKGVVHVVDCPGEHDHVVHVQNDR